ncbi:hypothetical protein [Mycobacterium sp. SMC-4]|uniref:hypothetical protein n=1 Tax=Mycobacterium sp. SMC-4 TaxID=2857059 RepID=UPI003CFD9AE2
MTNQSERQALKPGYSPVTFLSALVNILVVEFALWTVLPWFLLTIYVLPLLLIDLVVAGVLNSRPGTAGQIGRGLLIGLIAAPLTLVVFVPGLWLAQGLGLI